MSSMSESQDLSTAVKFRLNSILGDEPIDLPRRVFMKFRKKTTLEQRSSIRDKKFVVDLEVNRFRLPILRAMKNAENSFL